MSLTFAKKVNSLLLVTTSKQSISHQDYVRTVFKLSCMNRMTKTLSWAFLVFMIMSLQKNISGQCSILSNGISQSPLVFPSVSGARFSMAYNPNQNVYYTLSGNYIQTHNPLTGGNIASSYSPNMRSIWWNPTLGQLEGNGYGTNGTFRFTVNSVSGAISGRFSIKTGANAPNYNSQGAFDNVNSEIVYFNAGIISRYSRSTGLYVGQITVSGLPVSTTLITN
jgi:hypothetical protein